MKNDVIKKFNYEVSIETNINEEWNSMVHEFKFDLESAIADFTTEVQKAKNLNVSDSDFIGICLVARDISEDPTDLGEPQSIAEYFFEEGEESEEPIPPKQEIIEFLDGLAKVLRIYQIW